MTNKQARLRGLRYLLLLPFLLVAPLAALETPTHVLVGQAAVDTWTYLEGGTIRIRLDQILRDVLGLQGDHESVRLSGRTVQEWIDLGGELEDTLGLGAPRFLRHFHDPLKQPWDVAGLTFLGQHESSVKWMQNRDQASTGASGGNWSWHDARRMYYQALTEPDPKRRDALLADTFRALGQIMHLVVDASNPDHARNDPHGLPSVPLLGRLFWNYDKWVPWQHDPTRGGIESEFVSRFLANPIGFDPAILNKPVQQTQGGAETAVVPIARLIDADEYHGSNPSVTFNAASSSAAAPIGIAEISNANFFSENTLKGEYPFPRTGTAGLIRTELALPRRTPDGRHLVRAYLTRPAGQGLLPVNPLRAECAGGGRSQPARPYPCVDDVVWNAVAGHMLPRAVGYARGVLEYFFRGSSAVTELTWNDAGLVLEVQNTSAQEDLDGVFEIWARHQPATPQERRVRFATLSEQPVHLGPGERRRFERVSVPPDARPTAKYVLVFKGRIGLEEDAVAGQVFTVPYVDVRQTASQADTVFACSPPSGTTATSFPKATFALRSELHSCGWNIVGHRVTGTLTTNMPIDPATNAPEPAIARIELRWAGASLVLDGRPVAGAWHRQGREPDPVSFEIVHQGSVPAFTSLFLVVTHTNGQQRFTQMGTFGPAGAAHTKSLYVDNRNAPARGFMVLTRRLATGFLWYNFGNPQLPLFELVSWNRRLPGTELTNPRPFGGEQFPDAIAVTGIVYLESVIDDFEILPSAAADDLYKAIPLQSPHPQGPVYYWEAELRRVYSAMEREFLRAFFTTTPEPFVVTLTGQEMSVSTQ